MREEMSDDEKARTRERENKRETERGSCILKNLFWNEESVGFVVRKGAIVVVTISTFSLLFSLKKRYCIVQTIMRRKMFSK